MCVCFGITDPEVNLNASEKIEMFPLSGQ